MPAFSREDEEAESVAQNCLLLLIHEVLVVCDGNPTPLTDLRYPVSVLHGSGEMVSVGFHLRPEGP